MLMLAGDGAACADIEHLGSQEALFGAVASDSASGRPGSARGVDDPRIRTATEGTLDEVIDVTPGRQRSPWPRSRATA